MSKFYPSYCVLCEGKSEFAYLQELNKFIRENDIGIKLTLNPVMIGCGHYSEVTKQYRKIKELKKKDKIAGIIIWVDKDVYKRNENKNSIKYARKQTSIPNFKFNIYNFEDFLAMHLPSTELAKWQAICEREGHFATPMTADQYEPLLAGSIFPGYSKGKLPDGIITIDSLRNLKMNQADKTVKFDSDFAKFLCDLLHL